MPNAGENWLIVPAAPLLPSAQSRDQIWLLTLTGLAVFEPEALTQRQPDGWQLGGAMIGPTDIQSPLKFAVTAYNITQPTETFPEFQIVCGSASALSISGASALLPTDGSRPKSVGAGMLVDPWTLELQQATDFLGNQVEIISSLSAKVWVQNFVSVRRVSYNITLRGQIVFLPT